MSESFSPSRVEKAACSIGNEARSRIGNKECRSKRKGEKSGRIVNRKPTTMFVAWLKPPWQQITPYIADRRFCAPKMKRNGAKKGRKGGRAKVEKKMTARSGTAGRRGCAEKELEGVAMRWGRGDGFSAVRPHAALNHARTFFTFRSFNGAPFEGLPLWGWRRDFSRSPSANSRNTTNGSFHPYLRRLSSGSASLFLLVSSPPSSSNRIISRLFLRYPLGSLAAPVGISVSFLEILGIGSASLGTSCVYRRKLKLLSHRIYRPVKIEDLDGFYERVLILRKGEGYISAYKILYKNFDAIHKIIFNSK